VHVFGPHRCGQMGAGIEIPDPCCLFHYMHPLSRRKLTLQPRR
jgi:hypothetical protein